MLTNKKLFRKMCPGDAYAHQATHTHSQPMFLRLCMILLLSLVGIGSAWADEVTFSNETGTLSNNKFALTSNSDFYLSSNALTWKDSGFKIQAGTYTVGFPEEVTITKVSITGVSANTSEGTPVVINDETKTFKTQETIEWAGLNFNNGSFTFTTSNKELNIKSIVLTYTSGGSTPSPVNPTVTFSNGSYTVGGSALDLSALFTSNSSGTVTYRVKDANGTGAAVSGSNFTATTAGTAAVTATQAATSGYNAVSVDATITVNAAAQHQITASISEGKGSVLVSYDNGTDIGTATVGSNVNQMIDANSQIKFTATPATGYSFSRWSNGSSSSDNPYSFTVTAAKGMEAHFVANTTSITLNANTSNHGSGDNTSVTATYDAVLPSFTACTPAADYTLMGYFTSATSGIKVINADGTLVANVSGYSNASGKWANTSASVTLYAQYNKMAGDKTIEELAEMQVGDVFVPSATVTAGSLVFDNKILGLNADCDYKSGQGIRIKDNRYLAFKVPANTVIRVKVGNHHASDTRNVRLGTQAGGSSKDLSSLDVKAGTTEILTYKYVEGGVVYLSASADMYLKELAIVNLYTVTFKHNGHGTYDDYVLSDQSALPNPISKPAAGDGYTFVDWYNEPALLTPATPGADLTADKELYAKWMINKGFTIPFNGNGINVTIDHLDEPQRGMGMTLPYAYEISENISLPSNWDFQDGITGKGTYGPFQEAYKEGSIAAGNVLTQTVTGLANGRYEVVLDVAASSTNIRGNHNYPTGNNLTQAFAGSATQFIPVLDRTALDTETDYDRVALVAEVTDGTLTYGLKNIVASGNWYVCRVQSIKKIDDSNFTGWNTKADGTGTSFAAGENLSPNYNGTVLYAQWNKTYNFRPVAKQGTIQSVTVNGESVSFANNVDIKVPENATIVMTVAADSGYKFKNWSNNGTVGEESNNGLTYTISQIKANTTLTANFVALSDATDPNPANGTLSGTTVTINPFPASYANNTQTIDLNLPAGATFTVTSGNANVVDGNLSVVAPLANNSADVTIEVTAENGTTKNTYTVHVSTVEGASFSYTVNAVDGSTILKAIASGDYAQGTGNITVYYPQHVLVDNKLYELSKGTNDNGWYRKIFAPDANDYVVNIEKTAIVNNVVYFTEAEDLPGFTASTNGSANVRSSMGLVARSNGKFANACTLNKGTYRIVARSLSSHDRTAIFNVGNETYTFNYSSSVSGFDQRIVVTENNTDVSVAVNGDSSDGLDWFYIQDLGILPVTEDGQTVYLTKANYEAHSYFTSTQGSWDTAEKSEDGVSGIYMSFNQNNANVQLKTNGALAFEVFADANNDSKKFDVTVGSGSAVTYTIKKGLQTSGIIATGSNTADVDIMISKKDKTSLWPVKVKFYTKPLIVGAESIVTMGKGEQSADLNVVGGTAVLETPSTQASTYITDVKIEDGKLYATPVKAGVAHLSIDIVDSESNVLNTVDYIVNVKKQKVTLTYLANSKNSYTAATDGAFTSPTAVVKTVDGGSDVTGQVTPLYVSDDESLVRYNGTEAKLVPNMQGVAKLKAVLYNDPVYEAENAIAEFTVNVAAGIEKHLSSSIPAINSTLVAKDGEDVLMTMTYGGYKYGQYTHSDSSKGKVTDSWKGDKGTDSNTSAYGGQGTDIFGNTFDNEIDGFGLQAQAQYDSRDEYNRGILWFSTSDVKTDGSTHYTKNERIKPFSLPVKGAYLKFEAEVNGTLTAYVLQNGNINFDSGDNRDKPVKEDIANKKRAIGTTPRVYYWFNQDGYRIDPISYTSKQPLTIGRDYNNDIKNELDGWYGSNAGLQDMLESGGWPTQAEVNANLQKPVPTPQPVVRYNDGYMVAQKAYVKYVIPVVAGDTYYFFSNGSKVGAAGFNFLPSEDGTVDLILPEDGGSHPTIPANTNDGVKSLNCTNDVATTHKTTNSIEMYKTVTLPRKFKVNTWSTICLPFHVTETQVEKVFGKGTNLVVYNGLDGTNARFQKHVNQDILAGQPYLIYPTGAGIDEASDDYVGGTAEEITGLTFTNVNFTPNVAVQSYASDNDGELDKTSTGPGRGYGTDEPSYNFMGTLGQTAVKTDDYYVNNKTGILTRYTGSKDITLNAYYAYLKKPVKEGGSSNSAKAITGVTFGSFDVEDESDKIATAIMEVMVESGVEVRPVDGVFNLSGQKVANSTKNLPKGIYIINGQKISVK